MFLKQLTTNSLFLVSTVVTAPLMFGACSSGFTDSKNIGEDDDLAKNPPAVEEVDAAEDTSAVAPEVDATSDNLWEIESEYDEPIVDETVVAQTEASVSSPDDASEIAEPVPEPPVTAITEEEPEESEEEPEFICDPDTDVTLYLSPDDSNSMSSPVQVREHVLGEGYSHVNGIDIRPWEFMNYYSFDYPAADEGGIDIHAELRDGKASDEGTQHYRMQIGLAGEATSTDERAPMNVTLVLDTSGSMSGEPMRLLQESCRAIAASLKEGDNVSMVEWDVANNIRLANHVVSGPSDSTIRDAIDALSAGGGTDLAGGLQAGYELAKTVYDPERINRIVLISDGGANVGVTSADLIAENSVIEGSDGIYLVGAGVGQGSYNDELMNTVTDAGKGAAVFINDTDEAWKIFNANFVNTMDVAAYDVQVELALPPGFNIIRFSGEEFSSDPTEIEPQHLAPNDAMVFFQELETCAPEHIVDDTEFTVTARYFDAATYERKTVTKSFSFTELLDDDAPKGLMDKGAAILAFTDALKAMQTGEDREDKMNTALLEVSAALVRWPEDEDLKEIRDILLALM